jgi:hypothetical protein
MCDTEVYTIRVDSYGSSSNTSFIGYMNIPLRNVIKAELLMASLYANSASVSGTSAFYVHIEELKSKFFDKTYLQYNSQVSGVKSTEGPALIAALTTSNVGQLNTSMVCIPIQDLTTNYRTIYTTNGFFPVEVPFIEPIRQIQQFTVNIYTANGDQPKFLGPTYLNLRITCSKPNRCLYPDRRGEPLL